MSPFFFVEILKVMSEIIFETKRLYAKKLTADSIFDLKKMLQDPRVMYAYEGIFDDEMTEDWLNKMLWRYDEYGFALNGIYLKTTDEMIGQCGITMQEYQNSLVHEIGYLFCTDFWHQGYATEAAKAARDYAFTVLKAPRVFAFVRDTNTASMNVARRCGLKAIDIIIKHYRNVIMPHIVFVLTQNEWSLLKSQDQST
ncbi:GNAT family N-acetyltransferase [Succinatimonas hippei]|uniref:GNAT family N-acetyltransferase n=1 Tax=Succinatimonas hippei TaxID=626938 RepID=UPI0023F86737|nr:GNAT family N-acetyltransferase [Succinatimonas hippei]